MKAGNIRTWVMGILVIGSLIVPGACASIPAISPAPVSPPMPISPPVQEPTTPAPAALTTPSPTPQTVMPAPATATLVPATTTPVTQGDFVVSDLTVTPNTIRLFNYATVTAVVTNKGTTPATYNATLNVKPGTGGRTTILPSPTQGVTLAAGESKTVSFNISIMGNGTHVIGIDGLWERLSVDSQI